MTTRHHVLAPHEFYHCYNRGTDKRTIFLDSTDYLRFTELLYLCNTKNSVNVRDIRKVHENVYEFDRGEPLVSVGAYCLMPNHFHMLLTTSIDNGISMFINKVSTAYSMYFNRRYDRSGSLFQGSFKSQHADSDEYLKYLYAYIHLNPVKLIDVNWKERGSKDAVNSLEFAASFQHSSLPDYLGSGRKESKIVDRTAFPLYFPTKSDITNELFEWLKYETSYP